MKILCFCVENGWKKCDFSRLVHGKGMPMTHGGPEIRILDLLSFTCTKTHHLRSVEPSKQPINSTRRRKSGVSLKKCILVDHNYGVLNQNLSLRPEGVENMSLGSQLSDLCF